ncbi:MAG: 3'(2'),5'-bisphosphate nucleotidase [Myxococcota bacterium]|nr:3'(2'),5'-bisphosphate nucleotidase [Myxococcota bacterium]
MTERDAELAAAVDAVRAASRVCIAVQRKLVGVETLEKHDKSPVTVADFASQAIVCRMLAAALPGTRVVGEEDSAALRAPDQAPLAAAVAERVGEQVGETELEQVLDWIDLGGADASGDRYWTLDPIDGTKGFLRGEQYAVALALIEQGQVVLGVLGCPNLMAGGGAEAAAGAVFSAVEGRGAEVLALEGVGPRGQPIQVTRLSSPAEARFCESVESGHSNQDESARIAEQLGITRGPYRIDSQCKYAAIARGDAQIYLRMPTRKDYREKIWDHAAGKLVVECAGGRVTDAEGRALDFAQGRTLEHNRGVVATCGPIHDEVLEVVARVRAASAR